MEQLPNQSLLNSFLSAGQIENEASYKRFETLAEIFTWMVIVIGILIVQLPFAQDLNKNIIYILAAGVSVFTLIWYHLLPKKFPARTKNFIYSFLVNLFIAFLVHFTGGVSSYIIFLYFLANLRVGMTMPLLYTVIITLFTVSLIFLGAFLTVGPISTNVSLAVLHSFALVVVVFFGRFYAGEASLAKQKEEEVVLEKEKTLGRLKDEFVFILSKELKQPTTAVKGYVEKIINEHSDALKSEAKEILDLSNLNSDRLNKLLDELLDVSQIEKKGLEVQVSDVFLKPIISEVLSNQFFDAKNKKISLSQQGDIDVAVKADLDRLKEVLTNLINNAIKYSPEGGQIVVEVKNEGDFAKVSVIDNGAGISEVDQKSLFEKFYRVENKQTEAIKGSGLGLFIAKNLVEKMGGEMGVVSKLGKGSAFFFKLPRYRW